MARGDALVRGLTQRITTSAHAVTVHYRAVPAVAPSPLTNPFAKPALAALPTAPTPVAPPVTVRCLWHDRPTDADNPVGAQATVVPGGWYEEATAVARVLIADISKFNDADTVQFNGQTYHVLNATPVGAGFRAPATAAIWLRASQHQA